MEVTSLDSPGGTSSGYCSGTEEDLTSVCESGLADDRRDVLPGSAFSPYDPEFLTCPYGSSSPYFDTETAKSGDDVPEFLELGLADRNLLDLWNSWFPDMTEENSEIDVGMMSDLSRTIFDDPCSQLILSEPPRGGGGTEAGRSFGGSSPHHEEGRTREGPSDPLCTTMESVCSTEEDWNRMLTDVDWDRTEDGNNITLHADGFSPLEFFEDCRLREKCNDPNTLTDTLTDTQTDAYSRHTASPPGDQNTTEICHRLFDPPSEVKPETTSEGHPAAISSRLTLTKPKTSNTERNPTKNRKLLRTQSSPEVTEERSRTSTITNTTTTTTTRPVVHYGLEDHRYSSRRCEIQVVKPRSRSSTSCSTSPCSVLEALLRTRDRLNPNKGSNAILCKDITRKRGGVETPKHPQRNTRPTPASKHQNTLLHNLLTCRMDEMERRKGIRGGGKVEEGRRRGAVVEAIIPSDNPMVDCSFLFEEESNSSEIPDFSTTMAWSDSATFDEESGVKGNEFAYNDEDSNDWFRDCFNRSFNQSS